MVVQGAKGKLTMPAKRRSPEKNPTATAISDLSPSNWLLGKEARQAIQAYLDILPRREGKRDALKGVNHRLFIALEEGCGGDLLTDALARHDVQVGGFLNVGQVVLAKERHQLHDFADFCASLANHAQGHTLAVKGGFRMLMPLFLGGHFPAALPKWHFVAMTRENLLQQAIAQIIAEKAEAWRYDDKPARTLTDADYSFEEVATRMRGIASGYAWLEFFFAAFGIDPLRIAFEETAANAAETARRVLDFAGVAASESAAGREFRQRPEINALVLDWEKRYRADANMPFIAI
jgi:hypothetical protein